MIRRCKRDGFGAVGRTIKGAAGLGAVFAFAVCGAASAAVDLSGYWQITSDPSKVAPAKVKPAAKAELAKILSTTGLDAQNGSLEYAATWCTPRGIVGQTIGDLPIEIRQSPIETAVVPGVRGEPRHIYTDGQKHPPEDEFERTSVGHSIGRWQGAVFIADTMGFSALGVRTIPGGALLTEKSHLVERYELTAPDMLKITYVWTDPTLQTPHTYALQYERVKGEYWAPNPECNPLKAMRAKGLPLPPDAPAS